MAFLFTIFCILALAYGKEYVFIGLTLSIYFYLAFFVNSFFNKGGYVSEKPNRKFEWAVQVILILAFAYFIVLPEIINLVK